MMAPSIMLLSGTSAMTSSRIAVRRLLPAEAEAFRAIRLEALATCPEAFATTYAKQAADPPGYFAETLRAAAVFGAFRGEEIVGMAGLRREPGDRKQHKGVLWGMYVRPAARGLGLGRALLRAVLEYARGEVEQVLLLVVSDNRRAVRLYESEGFVSYGLERRALKQGERYLDEYHMMRFLT
jgi:ribosomal protein S18 acetylase RimI-like enzyme